jgi:response regulator RpfG family c-di-GMP phosphodiesterase
LINKRKDSSLVWVTLLVNGVYDDQGTLQSIVGFPVDMTKSYEVNRQSRLDLYKTIADLAELRDDDTGNHMRRVGLFAKMIAKNMGRNEKYCNDLEVFAPMHDIGKVGIPDSILLAPRRLTPEEFEIMKQHVVLGHNIVKGKKEFEMAAAITLCHHERYDGTGYPNGISGKHIPLSAQITALCDVYDALRSKRPYKEPWPHGETVAEIMRSSGTHFNPDMIKVFETLHPKFETIFAALND